MAAPEPADGEIPWTPRKESCLFLADWEATRAEAYTRRRKHAEDLLCNLQLRARSGLASMDAWIATLDSRRKLEEVSAAAATKAIDELEAHWRPVRIEACDGEAAAWLLASERAHAAALAARAGRWASSLPAGGLETRKQHQAALDELTGSTVAAVRAWDAAHEAARQAWGEHNERLVGAQKAVAEERAPPDSWLSEVRYRERARSHLAQQAAAERALAKNAESLLELEVLRGELWEAFTASYSAALVAAGAPPPAQPVGLRLEAARPGEQPALLAVPEMPSASGFVQRRCEVSVQADKGLFGIGGGGWREGSTLVLTLHGYMHVFVSERAGAAAAKAPDGAEGAAAAQGSPQGSPRDDEELVESNIKASVYVPMATRCVFLRRGKDMTVDLAEAEVEDSAPAQGGGAGDRLRKWIGRGPAGSQPVPRRIFAKVTDAAAFAELETTCHTFVRRGQGLRAAAGSPPSGGAPGGYPAGNGAVASVGASFGSVASVGASFGSAQSNPASAMEAAAKHLVDNGELKADAPGLEYRLSKNVDDRAGKDVYVRWGTTVMGVNSGDGWLKVGDKFLPMNIRGSCVVRRA